MSDVPSGTRNRSISQTPATAAGNSQAQSGFLHSHSALDGKMMNRWSALLTTLDDVLVWQHVLVY